MTPFAIQVYTFVKTIPKGTTVTYKQVAEAIGSPNASRAVGSVLKQNFDPSIPCHRVIRSDGKLGEYNRGSRQKEQILREEGAIR